MDIAAKSTSAIFRQEVAVHGLAAGVERIPPKVCCPAHDCETVEFTGVIETPPHAGAVVCAEWDFDGAGAYPVVERFGEGPRNRVETKATYTFETPGTYFPALRGTSQREGNAETQYARIQNLGRVRVVVK